MAHDPHEQVRSCGIFHRGATLTASRIVGCLRNRWDAFLCYRVPQQNKKLESLVAQGLNCQRRVGRLLVLLTNTETLVLAAREGTCEDGRLQALDKPWRMIVVNCLWLSLLTIAK